MARHLEEPQLHCGLAD
uniref:Uncharacterized protein n=1 Tax=Arundo donax TaxID=35708 RepID=A0A0A9B394_ARUDO